MQDFEKLGAFYLGRSYDLDSGQAREELILYDSKDLVTHAVCVGMTGSGKTGLGIALLEEAAIDGIPAIIIDPKGDMANLLLTFPQMRGEDFLPWIQDEDARRSGQSPQAYAARQAEIWNKGLAEWGQDGDRVQRFRDAADVVVYTPGSRAGIPVSILKSLASPDPATRADEERLQERIGTAVAGLLGLLGIEADPVQSREHILLTTIFHLAWQQGQDLDLATLIRSVQDPPVARIGVLELETFYPSKERFGLVMALNNLLAAPGFSSWMEGEPLDIARFLHSPAGKPQLAVFSIAHLDDGERMFFVSLLLNQVLGWMREQSGTTSLRAILYMDEIFGYMPPVANPASKKPLLTLLKQARAFGLGVVLATQNPVDLDYKGLSNTGTWFIGRLQTERDKLRVLDGLEGAAVGTGGGFDRRRVEGILGGLGSRIFLMHNTHEDEPAVFHSRWALSYLRGPMTREQIKTLMDSRRAPAPAAATASSAAPPAATAAINNLSVTPPPSLPPDVPQFFLPVRGTAPAGSMLLYRPMLLGAARVSFTDSRMGVNETNDAAFVTPVTDEAVPVDWVNGQGAGFTVSDLEKDPADGAQFASLPPAAAKAKNYADWSRDYARWLYGSQSLQLLRSPSTGTLSKPGEDERAFRIRLQHDAREHRDQLVEQIRRKYAQKTASLQDRIRRAEEALAREQAQARQQKFQTAISFGTTLLGALLGRKTLSASTLGRATTAARGVGRSVKEQKDVGRAEETLAQMQQNLAVLNAEVEAEVSELQTRMDPLSEEMEPVAVKPKKTGISVQTVALVWTPYWKDDRGNAVQAW